MLRRLDWELASVDYIASKRMPVMNGTWMGNMARFGMERGDMRRMEHWVSRFSPRFLATLRNYVRRGMWGSPQQMIPTICATEAGCKSFELAAHPEIVFHELWDWTPSCIGLAKVHGLLQTYGDPQRDQQRFIHPFKRERIIDPTRYREFATSHRKIEGSDANSTADIGIFPDIRRQTWNWGLPAADASNLEWEQLPMVVRERCRKDAGAQDTRSPWGAGAFLHMQHAGGGGTPAGAVAVSSHTRRRTIHTLFGRWRSS